MSWITQWLSQQSGKPPASPRDRRLAADARAISKLISESSILTADAKGNPPNHYRFRFAGKGLALGSKGKIVVQEQHEVWVELGAAYPRMMPAVIWKTPIFHPNVSVNGAVCLGRYGTHWVPSLTLDELCVMLWDIIRMKNFDVASPYNRDAAQWVSAQKVLQFPLDHRPLRNLVTAALSVTVSRGKSNVIKSSSEGAKFRIVSGSEIEVVHTRRAESDQSGIIFIE